MDEQCLQRYKRHPASCQMLFHGRAAGIIIAIPFVFCFTLFGVFNLVGGTVLTMMSIKPKVSKKGLELLQKLLKDSEFQFEQQLDPMQLVGIILLFTGCLLVIIGLSLGIVACRSVSEDKRRRKGIEEASMSGLPLSTMTERSSRRTSSTLTPYTPSHRNGRKKSFPSENIASPILEEDSENDEQEWENGKVNNVINEDEPSAEIRTVSFRKNSCLKSREISFKVTWATDEVHSDTNKVEVVAEMAHTSHSSSKEVVKTLLTTDL